MKQICIILLLAIISFNCQKEFSIDNGPTSLVPTITTTATTSITNTTALSGGNITADGGAAITARGVCWSTATNPVVTGNHTTDGTGTGIFASTITGLTPNTTYHVRAYATNSTGTAYGGDSVFITTSSTIALPTVITSSLTAITSITATGGGNVTADGGATVTARGVCWSTTVNPVATGNHTTDGTGTGIFTSAITGLFAGTTYHVRAYATNSVGTAYGGDSVFTATGNSGTQIKRIIQSVTGTRQAYITTLTYDASNRLLTFKEWNEDSSFTPIKISGANYSSFTYSGISLYPVKNTITHEVAGVDSTTYLYDALNRVTEEKYYYNGQVSVRNTYTYLSSTLVVLGKYVLTSPGPALNFMGNDSLIFDTQQKITGSNSGNASNVPNGSSIYQYDNKNNPFALIDLFKHVFTLYCDDAKYFYRAPNNFTLFNRSNLPSGGTNIVVNYLTYNSGSYPLSATGSLSNIPGPTQNFTMTFEYY